MSTIADRIKEICAQKMNLDVQIRKTVKSGRRNKIGKMLGIK